MGCLSGIGPCPCFILCDHSTCGLLIYFVTLGHKQGRAFSGHLAERNTKTMLTMVAMYAWFGERYAFEWVPAVWYV